MKKLISTVFILSIISMLFVKAQSAKTDLAIDNRQTWILSLLNEQGISVKSDDYIFYCTGHHGIIWSLIASDSTGIHLYNGTTRTHVDYGNQSIPDTLLFIKNNINTIAWGLDSLADTIHLSPLRNRAYNPIYNELYIIKDGNLSFSYNDARDFYSGSDSTRFNKNLFSR